MVNQAQKIGAHLKACRTTAARSELQVLRREIEAWVADSYPVEDPLGSSKADLRNVAAKVEMSIESSKCAKK